MLSYGRKVVKHGEILIGVHLTVKKYKIKNIKKRRKKERKEITLSTITFTIYKNNIVYYLLLFHLYLLLFMGPMSFFDTIHESHFTILAIF